MNGRTDLFMHDQEKVLALVGPLKTDVDCIASLRKRLASRFSMSLSICMVVFCVLVVVSLGALAIYLVDRVVSASCQFRSFQSSSERFAATDTESMNSLEFVKLQLASNVILLAILFAKAREVPYNQ
ncbi:hypothetical protein Tco_1078717 [Tanacetum coccineum]|uniref:Uncharacterized protein n=1 Tax=Tanacetum coccineum TaxID=301880 RepID=A0ABQ5HRC1_9ASTR